MLLDHKVFVGRGNHRRDRSWARNLLDTNHNGPSDDNISIDNNSSFGGFYIGSWTLAGRLEGVGTAISMQ